MAAIRTFPLVSAKLESERKEKNEHPNMGLDGPTDLLTVSRGASAKGSSVHGTGASGHESGRSFTFTDFMQMSGGPARTSAELAELNRGQLRVPVQHDRDALGPDDMSLNVDILEQLESPQQHWQPTRKVDQAGYDLRSLNRHEIRRLSTFPPSSAPRSKDSLPNRKYGSARSLAIKPIIKHEILNGLSKQIRKVIPIGRKEGLPATRTSRKSRAAKLREPLRRIFPNGQSSSSSSAARETTPTKSFTSARRPRHLQRRHSSDEHSSLKHRFGTLHHCQHVQPHAQVRHFPFISAWAHTTRRPSELVANEMVARELQQQKNKVEAIDDDVASCVSGALDVMTMEEYLRETAFDTVDEEAMWLSQADDRRISYTPEKKQERRKRVLSEPQIQPIGYATGSLASEDAFNHELLRLEQPGSQPVLEEKSPQGGIASRNVTWANGAGEQRPCRQPSRAALQQQSSGAPDDDSSGSKYSQ